VMIPAIAARTVILPALKIIPITIFHNSAVNHRRVTISLL
jgi:hypothetical protein